MKLVHFAFAFAMAATTAQLAVAADTPKPATPTCGKTVEECQKVVDGLQRQVTQLTQAFQAAKTQRNAALAAKDDADLNAYLQQQQQAAGK